ncbi:type IV toxin-antitoxin system AbiEi family antitoxin domain-containing protein [Agromyces ramosus]
MRVLVFRCPSRCSDARRGVPESVPVPVFRSQGVGALASQGCWTWWASRRRLLLRGRGTNNRYGARESSCTGDASASAFSEVEQSRAPGTVDGNTRVVRFERETKALGGIARRSDLRRMGLDDEAVRNLVAHGRLIRVRQAWYALPGTDLDAMRACSIGGRLACASALRFHGDPVEDAGILHVELPANATARRLEGDWEHVRLHQPRHPSGGNRAVVDPSAARRQWERCGRATR